jgi:hypothetical protein
MKREARGIDAREDQTQGHCEFLRFVSVLE